MEPDVREGETFEIQKSRRSERSNMSSCGRIIQMINELQTASKRLNSCLDVEKAGEMLLLSECITAGLQAFLFKNT